MNKRIQIPSSMRPALLSYAQELYRRAGGTQALGKRQINQIMSFVLGEETGKRAAWLWLYSHFVTRAPVPVKTPPRPGFYMSPEWRDLRFRVLKAADGRCALCGRSKREHGVVLHVDHIKPRSKFPHLALEQSNLQVLCEDCNLGKSNRDATDWRAA